jgi:hypothetical protein
MQQPAWGRSREFEITTRSAGRLSLNQSTTGDLEDDEEALEDDALVHGRRKRKVAFLPSLSKHLCKQHQQTSWIILRHYPYYLLPRPLAPDHS